MHRSTLVLVCLLGLACCLALVPRAANGASSPPADQLPSLTGVVTGAVTDALTGAPVGGVTVRVGAVSTMTDASGAFRVDTSPGRYDIRIEGPGLIGMTFPGAPAQAGETVTLNVEVVRATLTVEERERLAGRLPRWSDDAASSPPFPLVQAEHSENKVAMTTLPATIRVLMPDGQITPMDLEEYLRGVVPFEIGAASPMEAQKAQAVAARTYAATHCLPDSAGDPTRCEPGLDANVDTTTRTQVWRPSPRYDTSDQAIAATRGVALRLNGNLIPSALYFAHTREVTRDNEDAFNGAPVSYLRSVVSPDPFNQRYGHGVGMSQVGAMVLADWGARYADILTHYYTGVTVETAVAPTPTTTPTLTPTPTTAVTGRLPGVVSPSGEAVVQGQGQVNSTGKFGAWSITGETWTKGSRHGAIVREGRLQVAEGAAGATYVTPVLAADFEFQALSVRWQPAPPPGSRITVEARVSQDGASWGAWYALGAPDGGRDGVSDQSTDLHFELGRFAQARLTLVSESGLALDALTIHYYDGRGGLAPGSVAKGESQSPSSANRVPQPPIVSRSGWGAPEEFVAFSECDNYDHIGSYIRPNAFAVHHTGPPSPGDVTDLEWIRIVYNYHVNDQGWGDIGYNYVVGRDGTIYQGRARGTPPAGYLAYAYHAASGSTRRYYCESGAVMALGIYQPGETPLSEATLNGLSRTLAWLNDQYGIRPWNTQTVLDQQPYGVCGHRDLNSTECPGDVLYGRLDDVRNRVQTILDSQPPPATDTPTPRAATPTSTPRPPQPPPATPAVTPTVGPGCANLVRAGDFTGYEGQWTLAGPGAFITQSSALSQPLGLFLGRTVAQADSPGEASATQTGIALPTPLTSARLSLWYAPFSDGLDGDRYMVEVRNASGQPLPGGRLIDLQPPPNYRGWTYFERDVTSLLRPYAGQSIQVVISVYNDGNGLKTYVRTDDIVLAVCSGPTPTATATPTRTATATPTPTRTPLPITCGNWTLNGGFELASATGASGWTFQTSDAGASLTDANTTPGGSKALWLGRAAPASGMGYAAAWQTFNWPPGVTSGVLRFKYQARGGDRDDARVVELRDIQGGRRVPLLRVEGAPSGGWQTAEVPVEARLDGRPSQVYFAVLDNGGMNAELVVDDVALELCGRGLGGPLQLFLPRIQTWDTP